MRQVRKTRAAAVSVNVMTAVTARKIEAKRVSGKEKRAESLFIVGGAL